MSLEQAVEKYAKKWGVSREEAEKKIQRMLEREGREGGIPTAEKLFPEPLGPISEKIQDVNQALLSTYHTRRILTSPPEDVAALREEIKALESKIVGDPVSALKERIEKIDAVVGELKKGLETQIRELTETLEDKKRKETREELLKELDTKMSPLQEGLKTLTEKLEKMERGEAEPAGEMKPSEVLKEADKIAEEAKGWLAKLGYKVEPEKLSKEEVQKMIREAQKEALASLPPEELRKRLEQAGYKIVGGPLTYEQVEKLVEEARRRAQEEALEDKRIEAVQNIIRDSVGKIIGMFQPAIEIWMRSSLESRAGQTPPKVGGESAGE